MNNCLNFYYKSYLVIYICAYFLLLLLVLIGSVVILMCGPLALFSNILSQWVFVCLERKKEYRVG